MEACTIRQPLAGDIDWNEFTSLGFTHHMEIEGGEVFLLIRRLNATGGFDDCGKEK